MQSIVKLWVCVYIDRGWYVVVHTFLSIDSNHYQQLDVKVECHSQVSEWLLFYSAQ